MSRGTDDYDVFLNHRGHDVKDVFIAHLHDALWAAGLKPFLPEKSLAKGSPDFTSIDDTLAVAKVLVTVLLRGYAESKYCLRELVAMLKSGKPVTPLLSDVDFAEGREAEEREQEWADALRTLADMTGFVFCLSDYHG